MSQADTIPTISNARDEQAELCLVLWRRLSSEKKREVIEKMKASPGPEDMADVFERHYLASLAA